MNVNDNEIINLFSNILLYLLNKNKIILYKANDGLIVKINEESKEYIYIENKYIDNNEFNNLKSKNSVFYKIDSIDEIIESFEILLSGCVCNESFKYVGALEELKDKIKPHKEHAKLNNNSKNNKIPVPPLKGVRLIDFASNDKRIILLRDYPINTRHLYEEPMINNLSKIWRGHKLHKNFVIMEVNKKGHNIKCEFDGVGVVDGILCIFEIKNKNKTDLPHFLEQIYLHSKYIVEWLLKNKMDIKYIAPVVYFRESQNVMLRNTNNEYEYINPIYYKDVLNEEQLKINKLYEIDSITSEININSSLDREIIISKTIEESEEDKKILNEIMDNNPSYRNIMIKEEQYNKINEIIKDNNNLFNSVEDFIDFAFNNSFNTIELLKTLENNTKL
ncbi:hypothetical protein [Methanococcus aeolicus]|uniref:hypothetical protein n=1 Tax=Methanococcus aeolicus TaxID=42879 RepID=UPI0021CAA962|nr:hypothetical protein [Methanococcus aeolicus]UXM84447.1 hypothetical protein N6C89_06830 [Methanococcus aeolicus]